jgi:hypothetical protein
LRIRANELGLRGPAREKSKERLVALIMEAQTPPS